MTPADQRALLDQYCVTCHNARLKTAGVMLDTLNLERLGDSPEVWEKVAHMLRTGTMPPTGRPRPDAAASTRLAAWLEDGLDQLAAAQPNPGTHTSPSPEPDRVRECSSRSAGPGDSCLGASG